MIPENQDKKSKNTPIIFELNLSDNLRHAFNEETCQLGDDFLNCPIQKLTVLEKQLDKSLPWYKSWAAKVINLSIMHRFILFEIPQMQVVGSIDFYNDNRVAVRIGNPQTILQGDHTGKRKESKIANISPRTIDTKDQEVSLKVGDLLKIAYGVVPKQGFSEMYYNCTHFCQNIMKTIKKYKGKTEITPEEGFISGVNFDLK